MSNLRREPWHLRIEGRSTAVAPGFVADAEITYQIPPLPPGEYTFICDYHPTTMTGTLVVEEGAARLVLRCVIRDRAIFLILELVEPAPPPTAAVP